MRTRQQFILAVAVVGIFVIAFLVPIAVALLDGQLLRAIGTPPGSPSIPRMIAAGAASLLIIGGVGTVAGLSLYLRRRARVPQA